MKELSNGWQEDKTVTWNADYWEDYVDQTEACVAVTDCPCGEYIRIGAIGTSGSTSCGKCGRIYQVEIARRVKVYTPLAIRFPTEAKS